MTDLFFELLQVALGYKEELSQAPKEDDWGKLFYLCQKQSIAPFVFTALDKLNQRGQTLPKQILFEWVGVSERVKVQNAAMNQEAVRLTNLFEKEGHKTAVL